MKNKIEKASGVGLIIGAGVLLGIGAGFLFDNIPAGFFIGLGIGVLIAAIIKLTRK